MQISIGLRWNKCSVQQMFFHKMLQVQQFDWKTNRKRGILITTKCIRCDFDNDLMPSPSRNN